jgi:antitoxin FitA
MTLTIPNLDEPLAVKLRLWATRHGRSVEAEARDILTQAVASEPAPTILPPRTPEEMRERIRAITGIWKDRAGGQTTDELMRELRGDD